MIQSLDRGLRILDFMATRGGEASVSETARYLGVNRSTSSRLMATLDSQGFIEQDPETLRYRLGVKLLQLSNVLLQSLHLGAVAHDDIRGLAEQTGEGAHLAVLSGSDAVFLDHADGRQALTINTNVGDHDPLYCTAIGRALLSGLSDAEVRQLLARVSLQRFTRKTATSIDEVIDRLRIVRLRGYAFDDEERHAGVQCVAAPVRDHLGRVIAAIGISGPTPRMIRATEAALARAVREAGLRLSARLGHAPPAGSVARSAMELR